MKFIYLLLWILTLFALIIVYFQLLAANVTYPVTFFTNYVDIKILVVYLVLLALFTGVFLTLWISSFISSSNSSGDDFDL